MIIFFIRWRFYIDLSISSYTIWLVIFFVFHLLLPALIFQNMEKENNWSFTDSLYYCFATLFTIGFGDFVPGKGRNNPKTAEEMINGLVYYWFIIFWIFIGLVDINFITSHLAEIIKNCYVKLEKLEKEELEVYNNENTT